MKNGIKSAIEFLKLLGAEMKDQDTDHQADPRFWVVAQNKREYGIDIGYADGEVVIDRDGSKFETVKEFILHLIENDYLEESDIDKETKYTFDEILGMIDGLDFYTCGYKDIKNSICENTMFLTKAECKEYIKLNSYHYENPHTYAMTAWRSPQVEKLYDVLKNTDWTRIESLIAQNELMQEILTLDELKDMDGKPVWFTNESGKHGVWGLVESTPGAYVGRVRAAYGTERSFDSYGETWLACKYPPKGE